jgi:hypothetical protein
MKKSVMSVNMILIGNSSLTVKSWSLRDKSLQGSWKSAVKVMQQRNYFIRNMFIFDSLKMIYDSRWSAVSQAQINQSRKKYPLFFSLFGSPCIHDTAIYLDFTRSSGYQDTFFQWDIACAPVCRDPIYWLWKKMGTNFISCPFYFECPRFEDICAFSL